MLVPEDSVEEAVLLAWDSVLLPDDAADSVDFAVVVAAEAPFKAPAVTVIGMKFISLFCNVVVVTPPSVISSPLSDAVQTAVVVPPTEQSTFPELVNINVRFDD